MTVHTGPQVATKRIEATIAACVIVFTACAFGGSASGQSPADIQKMQSEIDVLRATQDAMREELKDLKALVQKVRAPSPATTESGMVVTDLSLRGAQIKGASTAKIVMVEFSDFQCPFCARHAKLTYPEIVHEYVDTGKLRYAFMNLPIDSLHPLAFKQHLAAACAADQGRFWEMHDLLFASPGATDIGALVAHAKALGLDTSTFRACVENELHAGEIRQSMAIGNASGINGTPTFLIGTVDADNKFKTLRVVTGARPYAAFKEAIEGALSAPAAPPVAAAPARLAGLPRLGNVEVDR